STARERSSGTSCAAALETRSDAPSRSTCRGATVSSLGSWRPSRRRRFLAERGRERCHSVGLMPTAVSFPARDGFALAGEQCVPAGTPRAAVVVATARGVPRRFYQAFAAFLAEGGLASVVFDYRGVGGSRPPGPLTRFRASLHEWGEEDLSGAI